MEPNKEWDALDCQIAAAEQASMKELPENLAAEIFSKIEAESNRTVTVAQELRLLCLRAIVKPKATVTETITSVKNALSPARETLKFAVAIMKAV